MIKNVFDYGDQAVLIDFGDEIKKESFRVFDTIGVFENLGEISEMKPVVKIPNKKIGISRIRKSKS